MLFWHTGKLWQFTWYSVGFLKISYLETNYIEFLINILCTRLTFYVKLLDKAENIIHAEIIGKMCMNAK